MSCQFLIDPFTNPDTMMKPSTRTLTHVNILLTMADSFTPRVKSPAKGHRQNGLSADLGPASPSGVGVGDEKVTLEESEQR